MKSEPAGVTGVERPLAVRRCIVSTTGIVIVGGFFFFPLPLPLAAGRGTAFLVGERLLRRDSAGRNAPPSLSLSGSSGQCPVLPTLLISSTERR